MSNNSPIKILVSGDVEGQFSAFISKITQINKKAGPFECIFCVGEFFGRNAEDNKKFLSGELPPFPIQVYIMGPSSESAMRYFEGQAIEKLERLSNVTYLGQKGFMNLASALPVPDTAPDHATAPAPEPAPTPSRDKVPKPTAAPAPNETPEAASAPAPDRAPRLSVVYFSGTESDEENGHSFNAKTVNELTQSVVNSTAWSSGIDVLLTSQWPADMDCYNSAPGPSASTLIPPPASQISKLVSMLKPRYHFAGLSGHYFERQPYRNHRVLQDAAVHVTRFVGLARFGNVKKAKPIYAFNITPAKSVDRAKLVEQPPDTTEPPYGKVLASLQEQEDQANKNRLSSGQFFYDPNADMNEDVSAGRKKKRGAGRAREHEPRPKKPFEPTGSCWFCLASPEVEKHLLVSVGTHSYVALPKGGLTEDSVLLLPINHIQSMAAAPQVVVKEVERFKSALVLMFATLKKHVVFFERNYKSSHLQVQCIPVPLTITPSAILDSFQKSADTRGIELAGVPDEISPADLVDEGSPYFWLELPSTSSSASSHEKFFYRIKGGFPLTFGRDILASSRILDITDRIDWRGCALEKEEEAKQAQAFQKKFRSFDFTSDSDDDDDDDGNDGENEDDDDTHNDAAKIDN